MLYTLAVAQKLLIVPLHRGTFGMVRLEPYYIPICIEPYARTYKFFRYYERNTNINIISIPNPED